MAATKIDRDWFHIVVEGQTNKIEDETNQSVNAFAVNFSAWETTSKDRAETIVQIEPLLNADLDFIVVQLGENVSDSLTFEGDFEYLIQRIKAYAPNAQIIIVGNFWPNSTLDDAKKAVASRSGTIFIDLSPIQDNESYKAGLGTVVYGEDGEPHIIEHTGVADHPNDAAMKWIAERILEKMAE